MGTAAARRRRLSVRRRRALRPLLAAVIAGFLLAGLSPQRAGAEGPARLTQAFVLASAPDSLADLKAHAAAIGVVYPTYLDCRVPGGAIIDTPASAITAYANERGLPVMPRFNLSGRRDRPSDPHRPRRARLDAHAAARDRADPGYAGICLDFENDGAADRGAMSSFVSALAAELHSRRRRLTVVVAGVSHEDAKIATGFYDDRALSASVDTVFAMAWGTSWEGSAPGPIAPLAYVAGVARYLASLPWHARFVLGAPMYGLDWPVAGGRATAYEYAGILALAQELGVTPRRDRSSAELTFAYTSAAGVAHRVWYLDAHAVARMLQIGRANGLAVGLWRLGEEDQQLWSAPAVSG